MAASMSAPEPLAAVPIASSVAGFTVANSPAPPGRSLPSMNRRVPSVGRSPLMVAPLLSGQVYGI
ncbi:Uncharacterised protein [Mycobacteroides abscessus subsp. abscessus]|nr:Uncharacterised protein [Mycobacteroides abscessus subsp. abscessus]